MSLLNEIKTNENARRLFGSKELKIIEKQLLGVNLTDSERIRLSRDIRKKFQVIKEFSEFSEEFGLKKSSEINHLVKETKETILESKYFKDIKRIYLFGSATENKLTLTSDIDIAIEFIKIEKKQGTKIRAELAGRVNSKVDIQVFNFLPNKIKKEIEKKGKIIYEK